MYIEYISFCFSHRSFTLREDDTLTCKTEKDAHGRLNYRTAGTCTCTCTCSVY